MNTEKLIQLITIQNQLLTILLKEYKSMHKSPDEKAQISELQDTLKTLQQEIKL
jgi:hypothetical protein